MDMPACLQRGVAPGNARLVKGAFRNAMMTADVKRRTSSQRRLVERRSALIGAGAAMIVALREPGARPSLRMA